MITPTRKEALDKLLLPITWDWSSSIRARQNLVTSRFEKVNMVMPFLTDKELKRVADWKAENRHPGLWD